MGGGEARIWRNRDGAKREVRTEISRDRDDQRPERRTDERTTKTHNKCKKLIPDGIKLLFH